MSDFVDDMLDGEDAVSVVDGWHRPKRLSWWRQLFRRLFP